MMSRFTPPKASTFWGVSHNMEPVLFCRLPGEKQIRRYNFTSLSEHSLIFGDAHVSIWPMCRLDRPMAVPVSSTSEAEYVRAVDVLKAGLEARGGKTVICRQICGMFGRFEPEALMAEYFSVFPDMFCFLFAHPTTGYWMGASPELLLEVVDDKLAKTRALAGTRPADCLDQWSLKNLEEHRIVVDDICARIDALACTEAKACEPYNFRYGSVEHLCTPIAIYNTSDGAFPADEVIAAIHPTPAVCGFPRNDALREIARLESVPRNFYGGLITVPGTGGTLAYVLLRCVHFNEKRWAIYTGSGITASSDAADEWAETNAKARPLLELLNRYH